MKEIREGEKKKDRTGQTKREEKRKKVPKSSDSSAV